MQPLISNNQTFQQQYSFPSIHEWQPPIWKCPHVTLTAIKKPRSSEYKCLHCFFRAVNCSRSHVQVCLCSETSCEMIHLFQPSLRSKGATLGTGASVTFIINSGLWLDWGWKKYLFIDCCRMPASFKHLVKCHSTMMKFYQSFIGAAVPGPSETLDKGVMGGALSFFSTVHGERRYDCCFTSLYWWRQQFRINRVGHVRN